MKKICLSLYLLFAIFFLAGCKDVILSNLGELEANSISILLAEKGIEAKKIKNKDTWSLQVDSKDVKNALVQIEASRILRKTIKPKQQSISFLSSKEEKEQALAGILARDLELSLEGLYGVVEARVHIHSCTLAFSKLASEKKGDSVGVLLIVKSGVYVEIEDVKKLISGATGISIDSISVLVNAYDDRKYGNQFDNKLDSELGLKLAKDSYSEYRNAIFCFLIVAFFTLFFLKKKVSRRNNSK